MSEAEEVQAAEAALRAGDFVTVLQRCRRLLAANPRHQQGLLLSGFASNRLGLYDDAVSSFAIAAEQNPADKDAQIGLLLSLIGASKLQEAIRVGSSARARWPESIEILLHLGLAQLGLQDLKGAVQCLSAASRIRPNDLTIRSNLGIAYELLRLEADAEEQYRAAIDIAPTSEAGYVLLARLMTSQRRREDIIELCERALEKVPGSAKIRLLYAKALRGLGKTEEAETQIQMAVQSDPEIANSAGFWMLEGGRFDEAAQLLNDSASRNPVQGIAYLGLVQSRKIVKQDADLLSKMEGVLRDQALPLKESAYLHYGLGKAYNDLGEYEKAMRHYDEGNCQNREVYKASLNFDTREHLAWIQRLIDTFSSDFIERYRGAGRESEVPIFIVGTPRIGSTLLEQIMSSHPDIGAGGELSFWLHEATSAVDVEKATIDSERLAFLQEQYLQLLRSNQEGFLRVTDKMNINYYWAGLLHIAFPDARFVHIRRNAVDTALSIYMAAEFEKPPAFAHVREHIVGFYQGYLMFMKHWSRVIPADKLLHIRYEDLVSDQEATARTVIDFCGLEWDPACLDHLSNATPVSTPSMWQARQPIYKTSMERWRNYEPWLGAFSKLIPEG